MRTAVLFTASAHDSQARTLVRDEQEPKQWDLGLLGPVSDGVSSPSANTHGGDGRSHTDSLPEHPRPNPLSSQAHRRAGARKKVPKGVSDGLLQPAAPTHTAHKVCAQHHRAAGSAPCPAPSPNCLLEPGGRPASSSQAS